MIKENGFFLLHRSIWNNPSVTKDADHFITWIYILSQVEYESGKRVDFGGKIITLTSGQMTIGIRSQMLNDLKRVKDDLNEQKLYRIIKLFESEKQIETQRSSKCTLITVLNYDSYQKSERQNEKQMKNRWKTDEKQMVPKKQYKQIKERKEIEPSGTSDTDDDRFSDAEWEEMCRRYEVQNELV